MDSQNQSTFSIASQETLLPHHYNHQQNKNNLKTNILFITFLILIILTAVSTTLFFMSRTKQPKPLDLHLSSSNLYYCHLTTYPDLCYDSMPSTINTEVIKSNPNIIFSTAIQVAVNQLNKIVFYQTNYSLVLSECQTWINDSLSRLNESLCVMIDSDIQSLTYEEMDNMKTWILTAVSDASKCLLALEKVDAIMGVEEVKIGVEKAMDMMVNSVGLLSGRETILSDFYNPIIEYDYDYYFYYGFDYMFLVCMYCGLYAFVGLLYFLFWKSN